MKVQGLAVRKSFPLVKSSMASVFSKLLIHLSRLVHHLRVQKAGLDMLTPTMEDVFCETFPILIRDRETNMTNVVGFIALNDLIVYVKNRNEIVFPGGKAIMIPRNSVCLLWN